MVDKSWDRGINKHISCSQEGNSQRLKIIHYSSDYLWAVVLEMGKFNCSFDTFQYDLIYFYYLPHLYVASINKIVNTELRCRQGLLGQTCSVASLISSLWWCDPFQKSMVRLRGNSLQTPSLPPSGSVKMGSRGKKKIGSRTIQQMDIENLAIHIEKKKSLPHTIHKKSTLDGSGT